MQQRGEEEKDDKEDKMESEEASSSSSFLAVVVFSFFLLFLSVDPELERSGADQVHLDLLLRRVDDDLVAPVGGRSAGRGGDAKSSGGGRGRGFSIPG